jgi:outer membrane biosynthesis protein TonB
MNCPNCGAPNPDAANFCGLCGTRLQQSEAAPAAEPPVSQADDAAIVQTLMMASPMADGAEDGAEATAFDAPAATVAEPAIVPEDAGPTAPDPDPAQAETAPAPAAHIEALAPAHPPEPAPLPDPAPEPAPEPAAAEPAADPEPEAAPAAEPEAAPAAAEPAPAPAPAPKAAAQAPAAGGQKGGDGEFRETVWFMQAVDQDSLANADNEDARVLQDKYKGESRKEVSADERRQFSLRAGAEAPPRRTLFMEALRKVDGDGEKGGGSAMPIVLVVVVIAAAAAGAFFYLK